MMVQLSSYQNGCLQDRYAQSRRLVRYKYRFEYLNSGLRAVSARRRGGKPDLKNLISATVLHDLSMGLRPDFKNPLPSRIYPKSFEAAIASEEARLHQYGAARVAYYKTTLIPDSFADKLYPSASPSTLIASPLLCSGASYVDYVLVHQLSSISGRVPPSVSLSVTALILGFFTMAWYFSVRAIEGFRGLREIHKSYERVMMEYSKHFPSAEEAAKPVTEGRISRAEYARRILLREFEDLRTKINHEIDLVNQYQLLISSMSEVTAKYSLRDRFDKRLRRLEDDSVVSEVPLHFDLPKLQLLLCEIDQIDKISDGRTGALGALLLRVEKNSGLLK